MGRSNVTLGDNLLEDKRHPAYGEEPFVEEEGPEKPSAVEGIMTETVTYSKGRNRKLRNLALKKSGMVCPINRRGIGIMLCQARRRGMEHFLFMGMGSWRIKFV